MPFEFEVEHDLLDELRCLFLQRQETSLGFPEPVPDGRIPDHELSEKDRFVDDREGFGHAKERELLANHAIWLSQSRRERDVMRGAAEGEEQNLFEDRRREWEVAICAGVSGGLNIRRAEQWLWWWKRVSDS
jgi:hypothetical protein